MKGKLMFCKIVHTLKKVCLKPSLLMVTFLSLSASVLAQSEQKITLTINHDRIVAGEPLLLQYQISGVPNDTLLVFKDREKGWISARLMDENGKEVGTFEEGQAEGTLMTAGTWGSTVSKTGSPFDENSLRYIAPKMTSDQKIAVPQTNHVTKAGVYRLLVRVRMLAALKRNGPLPRTPEEEKSQQPKNYRPLKADAVFRVVVTSVDPVELAKKAAALRDTFVSVSGTETLKAAHELIDWPSASAMQEWHTLAKDERCKPEHLEMFADMLAYDASPNAIKFLGELTWDTKKLNMRSALVHLYVLSQNPSIEKQIAAMFTAHGEEIPKNSPLAID